jgi:tetratricopeptide (TPR) repeat protein
MRVLFSTGSPAHYMAPPRLAREQINCGPDWSDTWMDGRITALNTPVGAYDLAAVVARLPPAQRPDLVVCLVDASRRNFPANLKLLRCPKVLLLADTHHCESPLTHLIRYAGGEAYDRIVVLYDRHHIGLLRAAGLKNIFWFPGLTFPHADEAVKVARQISRVPTLAFVGQRGRHHPRRSRLLDALDQDHVPLQLHALPQAQGLNAYGGALLGFNASLNGDLNLRAFEILAAGGMLLTDRLGPESGLFELWREGKELITYGTEEELVERARYYFAHPEAAKVIAASGEKWFDTKFNASWRQLAFAKLVSDGIAPAEFALPSDALRVSIGNGREPVGQTIALYDFVQEIHRCKDQVAIAVDSKAPSELAEVFATLPRVRLLPFDRAKSAEVDLMITDRAQASVGLERTVRRVYLHDVPAAGVMSAERVLGPTGLWSVHQTLPLFGRDPVEVEAATTPGRKAYRVLESGDYAAAMQLAQAALKNNATCPDALLVMADLALELGNRDLAKRLFTTIRRVAPADERALELFRESDRPETTRRLASRLLTTARRAYAAEDWVGAAASAKAALAIDPAIESGREIFERAQAMLGNASELVAAVEPQRS